MISMTVSLEGDGAWPDLQYRPTDIIHLSNDAKPIRVVVLNGGMETGRPSLAMRIDLPDGKVVVAETSARLFCSAAKLIMSKYPDLFVGD